MASPLGRSPSRPSTDQSESPTSAERPALVRKGTAIPSLALHRLAPDPPGLAPASPAATASITPAGCSSASDGDSSAKMPVHVHGATGNDKPQRTAPGPPSPPDLFKGSPPQSSTPRMVWAAPPPGLLPTTPSLDAAGLGLRDATLGSDDLLRDSSSRMSLIHTDSEVVDWDPVSPNNARTSGDAALPLSPLLEEEKASPQTRFRIITHFLRSVNRIVAPGGSPTRANPAPQRSPARLRRDHSELPMPVPLRDAPHVPLDEPLPIKQAPLGQGEGVADWAAAEAKAANPPPTRGTAHVKEVCQFPFRWAALPLCRHSPGCKVGLVKHSDVGEWDLWWPPNFVVWGVGTRRPKGFTPNSSGLQAIVQWFSAGGHQKRAPRASPAFPGLAATSEHWVRG